MSESFPNRLRKARTSRGWSQGDLAKAAKFQPAAISHFETGRRSPSFDNLKRLADALSVSIDSLLGRSEAVKAAGPLAESLFRDFEKMSVEDQELLVKMATLLAKRNSKKRRRG